MAARIETMREPRRSDIPAAGHDWFLPLYDPLVKLLGAEPARRRLLDQATLRPGHRVLDIGCGTGSLVTLIKRLYPDVHVTGLDPDPKALTRARRKAERASVSVELEQGFSDDLPYPERPLIGCSRLSCSITSIRAIKRQRCARFGVC